MATWKGAAIKDLDIAGLPSRHHGLVPEGSFPRAKNIVTKVHKRNRSPLCGPGVLLGTGRPVSRLAGLACRVHVGGSSRPLGARWLGCIDPWLADPVLKSFSRMIDDFGNWSWSISSDAWTGHLLVDSSARLPCPTLCGRIGKKWQVGGRARLHHTASGTPIP